MGSFKALFDASSALLPYPTDLYFAGSDDGTLAINLSLQGFPLREQLNSLDGVS